MISVYAQYFTPTPESGFNSGDTEQLLWSIPNQNGSEKLFLTATVNNEMGSAGNFEFSVPVNHPYYRIWKHMRTILRVVYDGTTIFYGRVLTIDRDMFRTKRIHCEGAMTFFIDSVFEGMYKGTNGGNTETLDAYLNKLLDFHNRCMDDDLTSPGRCPEKKIYAGEMPGHYTTTGDGAIDDAQKIPIDTQKRATTKGYKTTKEWLDELVSDYGGSMRVRYNDSDHKLYLDWMKTYFNKDLNNQLLSVNENVVDLSDTVEINNIFTHVVAVGKNNKYAGSGGGGGGGGTGNSYHVYIFITGAGSGWVEASSYYAPKGTKVTISYGADYGSVFKQWSASAVTSGVSVEFSNGVLTIPASDVNVTVEFAPSGGFDPDEQTQA